MKKKLFGLIVTVITTHASFGVPSWKCFTALAGIGAAMKLNYDHTRAAGTENLSAYVQHRNHRKQYRQALEAEFNDGKLTSAASLLLGLATFVTHQSTDLLGKSSRSILYRSSWSGMLFGGLLMAPKLINIAAWNQLKKL